MSFKKNVVANYVSQVYVTLVGIVMVPIYVQHMGAEAYGLVGFFVMLQAWFQLLDLGLTPTMTRATAQYRGGASDALSLRRLLRALESIFIGVAAIGAIVFILISGKIANDWLNVQRLPVDEVRHSVMLMGIIVALRWVSGLYRGTISGFENMVWLSGFNIAIATVRFVFVIPLFLFVGTTPVHFFIYQLIIALVEVGILIYRVYQLLPKIELAVLPAWDWQPLRGVLKFSLSIAFTSAIWVLVSQTDKLVLSKLLPLAEYAYFTLAVLVAGGVSVLSGPISSALLPRLTKLATGGDETGFVQLYRIGTQLICTITMPAAILLTLFSEQLLLAWTGDNVMSQKAAPILSLYALGNGILAFAALPYYLQFSKGDLRLHLLGNTLFVFLLIPSLIAATLKFGTVGAGYAWVGANLSYFFLWVPVVHRKFLRGFHCKWLSTDILIPFSVTLIVALALRYILILPSQRPYLLASLIFLGIVLVVVSALSSGLIRKYFRERFVLR